MSHANTFAPDVLVTSAGHHLYILTPCNDGASAWCAEAFPEDTLTWGSGYAIEPRYLMPIIEGLRADGFTVDGE